MNNVAWSRCFMKEKLVTFVFVGWNLVQYFFYRLLVSLRFNIFILMLFKQMQWLLWVNSSLTKYLICLPLFSFVLGSISFSLCCNFSLLVVIFCLNACFFSSWYDFLSSQLSLIIFWESSEMMSAASLVLLQKVLLFSVNEVKSEKNHKHVLLLLICVHDIQIYVCREDLLFNIWVFLFL